MAPRDASSGLAIMSDLTNGLRATRDELAIWRAFLSDEIAATMRDEG
jgi:hypothetical protein